MRVSLFLCAEARTPSTAARRAAAATASPASSRSWRRPWATLWSSDAGPSPITPGLTTTWALDLSLGSSSVASTTIRLYTDSRWRNDPSIFPVYIIRDQSQVRLYVKNENREFCYTAGWIKISRCTIITCLLDFGKKKKNTNCLEITNCVLQLYSIALIMTYSNFSTHNRAWCCASVGGNWFRRGNLPRSLRVCVCDAFP